MARACFVKQTLRKANGNAMLLRAIDGRFIRSSVLFASNKNGDDNERLPPASKFFIPYDVLIYIYIYTYRERERERQRNYKHKIHQYCAGRSSKSVKM